jgi:hypothetical protein
MKRHRTIRLLLYDYAAGELGEEENRTVEEHCRSCSECAGELEWMRSITSHPPQPPSERLPADYWERFAPAVEQRLVPLRSGKTDAPLRWYEWFSTYLQTRWKPVAALSAAAMIVIALGIFRLVPVAPRHDTPPAVAADTASQTPPEKHTHVTGPTLRGSTAAYTPAMDDYLRRSKMLFIGISNMKLDDAGKVDLSAEKEASRELLHQARSIRSKPLDLQSAILVEDIQKVLIDLANMKDGNDVPDVEILRAGIHEENLLFKIRIAESRFDSSDVQKRDR